MANGKGEALREIRQHLPAASGVQFRMKPSSDEKEKKR